jgi:hypothetical protein
MRGEGRLARIDDLKVKGGGFRDAGLSRERHPDRVGKLGREPVLPEGREEGHDAARHQACCFGKTVGSVRAGEVWNLVESTRELNQASFVAKPP